MIELKPCPFCGCRSYLHKESEMYIARCPDCGASGFFSEFAHEEVSKWNRRASGWISVKERLPEKAGKYIVLFDFGESVCPSCEIECSLWNGKSWYHNYVSHWMPLPGSPEVKE